MHIESKVPWVAIVSFPATQRILTEETKYIGDGRDILLQGFHWGSSPGVVEDGIRKNWYRVIQEHAPAIKAAGFSWLWFPPASDSLAPQGYIPRRWHVLDSAFGGEGDLRAAIRSLEPVRAMADVVVNHRVGVYTSGADFADPEFPDNCAAITKDDDSGVGTGNLDTGETYAAGRDLDHTNPDVRTAVKTYLRRLQSVGFKGWRYDLVKGYHGVFTGEYNEATSPGLSVGEFFDTDRQKVINWIDATGGRCTAFDFPTRYLLHDSCTSDDYGGLRSMNAGRVVPAGLIGLWPSRAVTFVDNHDTEYRRDHEHLAQNNKTRHFPGQTVEMAYAYTLTHGGIPCVFWSHYFDWGEPTRQQIGRLIKVRKDLGIHARSFVDIKEARRGLYAALIDGKVAMKLGADDWCPGVGWQLAVDGEKYAVWVRGTAS